VYKDQEAWKQSVEKNPVLLTYELVPIYELIPPDDEKYNASRNILIAAVNRAVKNFDGNIPNFTSVPSIMQLPARESGSRFSRYAKSYTADPPKGYAVFGSGYDSNLNISAVKIDGINAKLNDDWKYVWDDHDEGWSGRLSVWVPTSDDLRYVACGYTSFDSHSKPPYKVAMLNIDVTGALAAGVPLTDKPPLLAAMWPNYNGKPVFPNLFYNNENNIYAPRWDVFNQSQS